MRPTPKSSAATKTPTRRGSSSSAPWGHHCLRCAAPPCPTQPLFPLQCHLLPSCATHAAVVDGHSWMPIEWFFVHQVNWGMARFGRRWLDLADCISTWGRAAWSCHGPLHLAAHRLYLVVGWPVLAPCDWFWLAWPHGCRRLCCGRCLVFFLKKEYIWVILVIGRSDQTLEKKKFLPRAHPISPIYI